MDSPAPARNELKQGIRLRRFLLASAFSALYLAVLSVFYAQDQIDRQTLVEVYAIVAAFILVYAFPNAAYGYVEVPMTLGDVVKQSTNVCLMQVTKVDREKNLILYQKLQDIKGKHPQEQIKHNIGRGGLRPEG